MPSGSRWTIEVRRYNQFDGYYRIESVAPAVQGASLPLAVVAGAAPQVFETAVGDARSITLKADGSFGWLSPERLERLAGSRSTVLYPVPGRTTITQVDGDSMGRVSHDAETRHAVDIQAAMGETVVAALAGVVVRVEAAYPDLGCDLPEWSPRANMVVVRHGDGSEAMYGHLMAGSTRVSEGDVVAAGQPIARVGNSGRSNRPHLHFHVGGMTDAGYRTLPLAFRGCGSDRPWVPAPGGRDCRAATPP